MTKLHASILLMGAVGLLCAGRAAAQGEATYKVTFTATWSASTHPQDFPSNPHFSGMIGAAHSSAVVFWATGETASQGIKDMAELGVKAPLRSEVNIAIDTGAADKVLDGGGIGNSPGSQTMTFSIRPQYPLVTLVSMIAPSPDWFVGVRGLSMLDNNNWVETLKVDLLVYDAGTDSGASFTSANQPTNPPEPITRIVTGPFLVGGEVKPVGTFTFDLQSVEISSEGYFTTEGSKILDPMGEAVALKGVGLGGWLVPEGYMLHISAPDGGSPSSIRRQIVDLIGETHADTFFELYRANYVEEKDIAAIKEWGYDHIRLPFHYNLLFDPQSETFLERGFAVLDQFLEWCRTYDLSVILDMHAAPGAQSDGPIADSDGEARLWTEPDKYWPQTVAIWRQIARRYADEKIIVGYDLINEPVTPDGVDPSDLRTLYTQIIAAVRPVDPHHILFIEGNYFGTTFGDLEPTLDDNMVYAFHKYWNSPFQNSIQYLIDLRDRTDTPLWLGETGENSNVWFHAVVQLMKANDIGWNWWTHKKIESVTSPLSVPFAPGYQEVVNYWRGAGPRPSEQAAREGLFAMAKGLDMDSAKVQQGVLAALFDPDFITSRRPYKEHVIPGVINAVDYDLGNYRVTYWDADVMATQGSPGGGNTGGKYRNDGVDIDESSDPQGFGYSVGWTQRGEWLEYTVDVEQDGLYDVEIRVASEPGGGAVRLRMDNEVLGDLVGVEATGGWQNWRSKVLGGVSLTAGAHVLKIEFDRGDVNINRMTFTHASPTASETPPEIPAGPRLVATYPNPFTDVVRVVIEASAPSRARAEFYDMLGRRVFESAEQSYAEGTTTWTLQPDLAAGLYILRLVLQDGDGPAAVFTEPIVITH